MKPYIIDERILVYAHVQWIIMCILFYPAIYIILIDYRRKFTIILGLLFAFTVIVRSIAAYKHLKKYYKEKQQYLKVDYNGIYMNYYGEQDTIIWEDVKEIDICFYKEDPLINDLCFYLYLNNGDIYVFSLEQFRENLNLYTLRHAFRHFSNRPDIVRKRNLLLL